MLNNFSVLLCHPMKKMLKIIFRYKTNTILHPSTNYWPSNLSMSEMAVVGGWGSVGEMVWLFGAGGGASSQGRGEELVCLR